MEADIIEGHSHFVKNKQKHILTVQNHLLILLDDTITEKI